MLVSSQPSAPSAFNSSSVTGGASPSTTRWTCLYSHTGATYTIGSGNGACGPGAGIGNGAGNGGGPGGGTVNGSGLGPPNGGRPAARRGLEPGGHGGGAQPTAHRGPGAPAPADGTPPF